MRRLAVRSWIVVALTAAAPAAWAQMPPGGMRPMGPGPSGPPPKEQEGPAEAAPESQAEQPALQPLPAWPGQREKQLQFFQLDGYIRGRTYLFHDLNLGIYPRTNGPSPPFFAPYSEFDATGNPGAASGNLASCAAQNNRACRSQDITSADMRLRLEPTINVMQSEQVRVKAQIDIFDNLVLGSTPEGFFLNGLGTAGDTMMPAFYRAQQQAAPESGRNSIESAIRVKRAWAEVRTPIGELKFGRMPSHWGMGMMVNSGDCFDCDYGVNADRIMFSTKFKEHFAAVMWDWVQSGPTTRLFTPNLQTGQAYSADPLDDISQVGLALGRQDRPEELKERVDRGNVVLNYGGYFTYRWQSWDLSRNPGTSGTPPSGALSGVTQAQLSPLLVNRSAWAFVPNLWFRLNYRKFQLELEAAMVGGKVNNVTDQFPAVTHPVDLLQWGGVARGDYRFLHDALHIGLEVGYASGDQSEDPNAAVNYRLARPIIFANQTRYSRFLFSPDYHVDLILFRQILGTVYNATYFKPHISYDIIDFLSARLDVIYSLANVPVAFPGNSGQLGFEGDASIIWHNDAEGFYASIAYGIFVPLGALSLPGGRCDPRDAATGCEIYGSPGGIHTQKEAEIGQTFQARVVVKF